MTARIIVLIELIWNATDNPNQWSCVAHEEDKMRHADMPFARYSLSRDEHRITVLSYHRDCGLPLAKEAAVAYLDFKQTGIGVSSLGTWKRVDLNA